MKLLKIVSAQEALKKLSASDLTLKCLYWVRKLISKIEPELKFFYEERDKIIKKHSDGNGKIIPESIPAVNKEIEKLLELDIEVHYTAAEIPDTENITLSNNDISALEGFVKIIFTEDIQEEKDENQN